MAGRTDSSCHPPAAHPRLLSPPLCRPERHAERHSQCQSRLSASSHPRMGWLRSRAPVAGVAGVVSTAAEATAQVAAEATAGAEGRRRAEQKEAAAGRTDSSYHPPAAHPRLLSPPPCRPERHAERHSQCQSRLSASSHPRMGWLRSRAPVVAAAGVLAPRSTQLVDRSSVAAERAAVAAEVAARLLGSKRRSHSPRQSMTAGRSRCLSSEHTCCSVPTTRWRMRGPH